jgi:hypothetical protein
MEVLHGILIAGKADGKLACAGRLQFNSRRGTQEPAVGRPCAGLRERQESRRHFRNCGYHELRIGKQNEDRNAEKLRRKAA